MEKCLNNRSILANILAFLDGANLADLELICKRWDECIKQSSLWKVRCMVDIPTPILMDYINWHTLQKGELRFKTQLANCSGTYWKHIYSDWWNSFACINREYIEDKHRIERDSNNRYEIITCACLLGGLIMIGTNNGEVYLYSRKYCKKLLTVQKHDERIISVAMFNELHVNKYSATCLDWANTFMAMTQKSVLVTTQNLKHRIVNDAGKVNRSIHFWKDNLVMYVDYGELIVYKVQPKSIWDGEHETRVLDVFLSFSCSVHEKKVFLSQIYMRNEMILTCYTDESFHGNLVIISLIDGHLKAHYLFPFSINHFIERGSQYLLLSYRKCYFFDAVPSVPQAPTMLTKEPKFIAVTPSCSYAVVRTAKFGCVSQVDKTLLVHFETLTKAKFCSENLAPFLADCKIQCKNTFKFLIMDICLDPDGPTLITLDNEGTYHEYHWKYRKTTSSGPDNVIPTDFTPN